MASETVSACMRWGVVAAIVLFSFWIRILVSLHPYSGAGTAPRFGDYEAQRHWMEITLHTPVREWYFNTTNNDLSYWGLDYPPLTAYQSLIHGYALNAFEPESVALGTSHGYETPSSKRLMRWTVLSSDAFIFFPAVLAFVASYYKNRRFEESAWGLLMILLQPGLILIDHGHFQYNCISLGLTVGAVAAICLQKHYLGSVLFCLALNHKQMSAYYAPAFFAYLFGKSLQRNHPIFEVLKLGMVVILTFVCCWWPFLYSESSAMQVLSRLVPLQRGIFEDYVANFWCATSLVIKWKRVFSQALLAHMALVGTILSFLPSTVQQIIAPSLRGFLLALFNSALSFYLFSYQVHEKSILLALIPASLLVLEEPELFKGVFYSAMFSMFPLLRRDELVLPYVALFCLYLLMFDIPVLSSKKRHNEDQKFIIPLSHLNKALLVMGSIWNVGYMCIKPPPRYLYIFEAMISATVFFVLTIFGIYSNIKQWSTHGNLRTVRKAKVQ